MGMSASQARLLTLTSRQSDLELRGQRISNDKQRLASNSEEASQAYSDALNKEKLTMITGYNKTTGAITYGDLNYEALTGANSPLLSQYALSDTNGNILVSEEIAKNFKDSSNLQDFLIFCGAQKVNYPEGYDKESYQAALQAANATIAANQEVYDTYLSKEDPYTQALNEINTAQTATDKAAAAVNSFALTYDILGYDYNASTPGHWIYEFTRNDSTNPHPLTDPDSVPVDGEETVVNSWQGLEGHGDSIAETNMGNFYFNGSETYAGSFPPQMLLTPGTVIVAGTTTENMVIANLLGNSNTTEDDLTPLKAFMQYTDLMNDYSAKAATLNDVSTKYDLTALKQEVDDYYNLHQGEIDSYTAALNTLNSLDAPITTIGNVDHYTNIYNRMTEGYTTTRDGDVSLNSSNWIQQQIMNGNLLLEKYSTEKGWEKTSATESYEICTENDDSTKDRAQAVYDMTMTSINNKDKKLDLELKEIDTEHSAVQTEIDSVKKVIDKNIERTFKSFDA